MRAAPSARLPVGAALLTTVACTGALDGPQALSVLRCVALLLAVAVAACADEPLARLLDASPTSWARRFGQRLAGVGALVVVAWAAVLGWAAVHGDPPWVALTLELAALAGLSTGLAAGLRRWRTTPEPAVLVVPALAVLFLLSHQLPRRFGLQEAQTWGPPWEASHLRWTALLLAALALLGAALADPATARRPRLLPLRRA